MAEEKYVPRLKTKYNNEVKQQLQDKFQYENVMMIPKFEKIVVNMGVGEAATDSKAIDGAVRDLRAITGQQPMITRARKSIATFRLRAGMPIGCKVTLRGDRMWEFFDRLTSVAIPRIRDFRGISAKSFDGRGNFSMGVTEQLIFPEIDFDSVDHQRGMDITFVTTANTDEEAKALLDDLEKRHPQLHDMALLSLRTGLRPTEIFKLRGQDVDANACGLYIIQKGGKRVFVRVPEDMSGCSRRISANLRNPSSSSPARRRPSLKLPRASKPPSENSVWSQKTATVCIWSHCIPCGIRSHPGWHSPARSHSWNCKSSCAIRTSP